MTEAKRVAERDLRDWKQRTWSDIYLKGDEAYDALDEFQAQHGLSAPLPHTSDEKASFVRDRNALIKLLRRLNSMAAVFPQNPVMNELFAITGGLKENDQLYSKESVEKLSDAVENVRIKARITEPAILD